MPKVPFYDKLTKYKGEYLIDGDITESKRHEFEEEVLKKEKELAGLVYYQRDLLRGL